jgi:UDP-N-acetylmuramoylalanine--D-glutamate ligase
MRILGRGKTAKAIQHIYQNAKMYDDNDIDIYDINSNELTIVSPGIPPYNYLVKNSKNIASDYDLFIDKSKFTIWVSGTNGKTTTTKMIHLLLKNDGIECGGNIGTPLAMLQSNKIVLETSSFTLHYTNKAKPNIYVLLPIHDDHISWHGTFQNYEKSKLKPLFMMSKNDIAIIPSQYKYIKSDATIYYYDTTYSLANKFNINLNKINFKEPFLQDGVIALVVEQLYKNTISYNILNSFIQDKHKLEEFTDKLGRIWIDDSKATNVYATIQALKSYKDNKIYLILGGDDKGIDLNPLFIELKNYSIKCFFIGSNQNKLLELSKKYNIIGVCYKTIDLAVDDIHINFTNKNIVAILSPAAASLDQFDSYKQRGEIFKKLVFNLSYN